MEGDRSDQFADLVAMVAGLTPRRRHDLEQRMRWMAETSEAWFASFYSTLADIIAEQQQADEHGETMGRLGETSHSA